MKYVSYDPVTGEILQWGDASELPPGALEHAIQGSLEDYYVDPSRRMLRPKRLMALVAPGPTSADGASEAVISGLPLGTRCTFYVNDAPYAVQVDDGTFEMTLVDPQQVHVHFWHPRFRHPTVTLEFT